MDNQFFKRPILNSPYEYPARHWELDEQGQPTQRIVEKRRSAEFITPIPKPRKRKDSPDPILNGPDLEEVYNTERHLLYVACTRARDHLLVTSVYPTSEFRARNVQKKPMFSKINFRNMPQLVEPQLGPVEWWLPSTLVY